MHAPPVRPADARRSRHRSHEPRRSRERIASRPFLVSGGRLPVQPLEPDGEGAPYCGRSAADLQRLSVRRRCVAEPDRRRKRKARDDRLAGAPLRRGRALRDRDQRSPRRSDPPARQHEPNRYRIVVYRLGWYGGTGARQVACLPSCTTDEQGRVQPGGDPPSRAAPARELARDGRRADRLRLGERVLPRRSGSDEHLDDAARRRTTYFILRQPPVAPPSQILVHVPVNTWEAYNTWGGRSLYNFYDASARTRVSFERPFDHQAATPLWWEIQLVRFLEREGYDVSYTTDIDTDANPASLLLHRLVIVAGHDEYWTLGSAPRSTRRSPAGRISRSWARTTATGTCSTRRRPDDLHVQVDVRPEPDVDEEDGDVPRDRPAGVSARWACSTPTFAVLDHPLDYAVTPEARRTTRGSRGTGLARGRHRSPASSGASTTSLNPYPESASTRG